MLALEETIHSPAAAQFAADVRAGLQHPAQKQLPSKYLYDAVGSALFDAITLLPEYGLTRADDSLLRRHAREIANLLPNALTVAELGSGNGKKTRYLLKALAERSPLTYHPIEISAAALAACRRELSGLPFVTVLGAESEYLDGLRSVSLRREPGTSLLVLFLGGTIGNFEGGSDRRFLGELRKLLQTGDALLLGADMAKPAHRLLAAYDDPAGVTSAFNLNLLARMNRELDADFDLRSFSHRALFNSQTGSVEMHLQSKTAQTVAIAGADCLARFAAGETIWTESSHKYTAAELTSLASAAGYRLAAQWADSDWQFSENLWLAL